jgi:hypothetical protein
MKTIFTLGGMRLQVSILLLNLVIRPSSQVPLHLNLGRGCGRLAPPPPPPMQVFYGWQYRTNVGLVIGYKRGDCLSLKLVLYIVGISLVVCGEDRASAVGLYCSF